MGVVISLLGVVIQLMFCFVHPALRFADHALIQGESLAESLVELAVVQIERVNHLQLGRLQLFAPLFELVLDHILDLHLPSSEERVLIIVVGV